MSGRKLDFWFDYTCPYAYIASTQVERLAQRMGAALTWQPMLLGGVFKVNDTPQNLSEVLIPPKLVHNALDFVRWAELFGAPLKKPAEHPMRSVEALRATIATGVDPKVIAGFYRAYWVEGRRPSDPATIRDVVGSAGHDPERVLSRIQEQEIKDDLRKRTDRAIALGIFGAPSFVVDRTPERSEGAVARPTTGGGRTRTDDKELYWGQDRMHFVAGTKVEDVLPPADRARPHRQHTLEVYFDFSSPFAYLGATQAEALAARTGAKLVWRPMLLGGLFKTIGQPNVPLFTWAQAKQRYYAQDLERWAAYYGVPYKFPTRFPMNTLKAMRWYLALPEDRKGSFRDKVFRAFWADDLDIADDAVLRELAGPDADAAHAGAQTAQVKQALIDATNRAAAAGVFGAPTWVVDGADLFWGQDRIPLVERALLA